ncbi:helix-turn-helix domain-containing protein [Methylocapsa sp. S129]|uniref:helix-turn-helix domain-containing protein n=1 Tax=Methylocapsa sp. S129 TaxID=1641869 RepID=UPI00131DC472|nr:helix-turn-helix transcriptional regulator [Methylocapsa sp. S129]
MKKIPNPIDRHVGARLRMRRMLMGLSQEKLGVALSITFQQIQKYEKGANRIGASRLQELARILQVPPAFFFEGAPSGDAPAAGFAEPEASSYVVDFLLTSEGLQLNRAFALIRDPKVRRRILDLVTSLAQDSEEPAKGGPAKS